MTKSYAPERIGKPVHYVSHGSPVQADGTQAFESECRAAIITSCRDDTTVGLCVLNPNGAYFNENCYFVGEHGPGYDEKTGAYPGGTWHWPDHK